MVDLARQEVARIRPEVVFSGESFEECSGIELPLMCNYTLTDMDCPLAMAVYGDRLDPFGYLTTRSELARNRLSWRMKLAEQFVYGMLIGTAFGRPSAEDADIVSLTRNLAQARNEAWRYLQAGRMMHPPELDGDNPMVTAVWETYGTGTRTITRPTVRASSWLAEDGTAALVFVSVAEKPVRLRWSVARKDLGLVGDKLRLWTIRPVSQAGPVRLEGATLSHEVTVPPLDATVLKLAPA
jgi:hypothetical protein